MLENKRSQIRRGLRREELATLFLVKRKELLQGKIGIFRELDEAIFTDQPTLGDIELSAAILRCLHNYPEEENSYIVAGNYLFKHNEKLDYFFIPIIDSPRYLENQVWCFKLMAATLAQQACSNQENFDKIVGKMEELVSASCVVLREMIVNVKRTHYSTEK
jgi:hypothetical protein